MHHRGGPAVGGRASNLPSRILYEESRSAWGNGRGVSGCFLLGSGIKYTRCPLDYAPGNENDSGERPESLPDSLAVSERGQWSVLFERRARNSAGSCLLRDLSTGQPADLSRSELKSGPDQVHETAAGVQTCALPISNGRFYSSVVQGTQPAHVFSVTSVPGSRQNYPGQSLNPGLTRYTKRRLAFRRVLFRSPMVGFIRASCKELSRLMSSP